MSYCVNCGVELTAAVKRCPLCNTLVFNPKQLPDDFEKPFPEKKGTVEAVNHRDFAVLLSVFVLATSITCGILNVLVFREIKWSLAVIGACVILWVWMLPIVIYRKVSVYGALILDGFSVALYLYMLAHMLERFEWFYGLGLPITTAATVSIVAFVFCVKIFPRSILTVALYLVSLIGVFCAVTECLIDRYLCGAISLVWSAIVLTICAVFDIVIITMLSRRRLRGAVRKRLHF